MKKNELKRILVPVDFTESSEAALSAAAEIAKRNNSKLFLIHVMEYSNYFVSISPEMGRVGPSPNEVENSVNEKFGSIVKKMEIESGIKPEVNIIAGVIHDEIIKLSKKNKIDLIVMGTHGTSGYKEMFIGSNAQRVVTLSEIPVLTIMKKLNKAGFKNILIPIDNSMHSREKVNLAMTIAELYKSKIHIIGLPGTTDKKELNKFNIKLKSIEKIVSHDKLPFITAIVKGDSLAKSAIDYATKNKCDLIVINTGHESKITGIFLGAFAQQIVNHSKIPVLSLKHLKGHFSTETPGFAV